MQFIGLRYRQAWHLTEVQHSYPCKTAPSAKRKPVACLEVAQRHHAGLCKSISGKAVTLHTVLLSVVGLVVIMNILCIAEEP
eukprot:scaffold1171_cov24-Tisochrysis_lutea.AAC.1